jgi:hypothetical protein
MYHLLQKDCFSDPFNRVERVLLACLRPERTPEVGVRTKHTNKILDLLNASSVNELANVTLYPANVIAPYSSISPIGWHTVDGWVLPKQAKQPREQLYSDSSNIVPTDLIVVSNSFDSPFLLNLSPSDFIAAAMNMETEVYGVFGSDHGATVMQAYSCFGQIRRPSGCSICTNVGRPLVSLRHVPSVCHLRC